jgi:hypothetical protein
VAVAVAKEAVAVVEEVEKEVAEVVLQRVVAEVVPQRVVAAVA